MACSSGAWVGGGEVGKRRLGSSCRDKLGGEKQTWAGGSGADGVQFELCVRENPKFTTVGQKSWGTDGVEFWICMTYRNGRSVLYFGALPTIRQLTTYTFLSFTFPCVCRTPERRSTPGLMCQVVRRPQAEVLSDFLCLTIWRLNEKKTSNVWRWRRNETHKMVLVLVLVLLIFVPCTLRSTHYNEPVINKVTK